MGAWLTYGLGNTAEDLPAFVVMTSRDKEASCGQIFYDYYWGSGFLPTEFQGVKFRGGGDPVLYLKNPDGMSRQIRRDILNSIEKLNEINLEEYGDPEIATRIAQYEMSYKMQMSVPELTDFQMNLNTYWTCMVRTFYFREALHTIVLWHADWSNAAVSFVQCMHAGWDQHRNLSYQFETQCRDTDAPSAALVKDLKQRGLLEDTLVIWGGEFGRTPFLQGVISDRENWGRDHHLMCSPYGWLEEV